MVTLSNSKGFSLVELITVIVILAIVGTVAIGKFENLSESAHNAATTADGWEYLGTGTLCAYLYKPDVTPFRIIVYLPDSGVAGTGRIWGINI